MRGHLVSDTSTMLGRCLRHILRSPDTILTTAVTPITLLLLVVVLLVKPTGLFGQPETRRV